MTHFTIKILFLLAGIVQIFYCHPKHKHSCVHDHIKINELVSDNTMEIGDKKEKIDHDRKLGSSSWTNIQIYADYSSRKIIFVINNFIIYM